MITEIKAPSPGESITEVEIASWHVADGDYVEKNQEVGQIESEKATLAIIAEISGLIKIVAKAGETVKVGQVICSIDASVNEIPAVEIKEKKIESVVATKENPETKIQAVTEIKEDTPEKYKEVKITPVAKKMMEEYNLSIEDVISGLHRIGKKEIEAVVSTKAQYLPTFAPISKEPSREVDRSNMSSLRKKLSQRLVSVKNETAMLTTFNEIDMSNLILLRKQYQNQFFEKFGIKLGFMSFFTKAAVEALKLHPNVNSMIDGDQIVSPRYVDVAIAVQTNKGLMVPVLRNAESLTIAGIETGISELADKARNNKITLDEMTGGTFTISNGGVFGSMLSTPILNPPQSGILGMHNIIDRPVAISGKVEIRPMMYVALSYDHRVIDGRDSVGFLVKVKELIENPVRMMFDGQNPEKILIGLSRFF